MTPTILIAEDVEINMVLCKNLVQGLYPEATILEATNGEEVLLLADAQTPDVILMDVKMPKMDGLEATRQLRARFPEQEISIIALTAGSLQADLEETVRASMDAYITKPLDADKLRAVMEEVLG